MSTSPFSGKTYGKASTNPVNNVSQGTTLTQGQSFTDSAGRTGIVNYDVNTGAKLANQSTTTLSTANAQNKVVGINTKQTTLGQSGVTTDPQTGTPTYANGTVALPPDDPSNKYNTQTGALNTNWTGNKPVKETNTDGTTSTGGYFGNVYIPAGGAIPQDNTGNPVTLTATNPANDEFKAELERQKTQSDANGASNLTNIGMAYDNLIKQQEQANTAAKAGTTAYLVGGGAGVVSSDNVMLQQVSYGLNQIGNLNLQRNQAIVTAQQAILDGDYKYASDLHTLADNISKQQQDAYTKVQDAIQEANQTLMEKTQQAQKDNAIATLFSSGVTDPAQILSQLQAQGNIDITAKDIADTLGNIANNAGIDTSKLSASVQEFYALKNQVGGLPVSILALPSVAEQIAAYLKMKTQAETKVTPSGSSTGTGAAVTSAIDPVAGTASKSILAATGLSMPAFMFLTTGTSALTRMSADQRVQYMNEAEDYVNRTGTDVATFRSQYDALSSTVKANLLRNNQAAVAESELDATIKNVSSASTEANLGKLSKLNAAKIWAGKQLNDANATTFKFHLEQLRREFAMYNAAIEGQIDANGNIRQITDADLIRADNVINDGFAKGSITGFETALKNSMDKMKIVLENSINAQNKQVWNLFGIGDKYQAPKASGGSSYEEMKNSTTDVGDYNPNDPSIWE